jgi:hypothetical protein
MRQPGDDQTRADRSWLSAAVLAGLLVAVFLAAAFASHGLWGME